MLYVLNILHIIEEFKGLSFIFFVSWFNAVLVYINNNAIDWLPSSQTLLPLKCTYISIKELSYMIDIYITPWTLSTQDDLLFLNSSTKYKTGEIFKLFKV